MKRKPTFLLLGPLLSWLYCIACLTIVNYPGPVFDDSRYWSASFMGCFVFALLPLWIAAVIDRKLSHWRWRAFVCFLAGVAMASTCLFILAAETGSAENVQRFYEVWWYVGPAWGLPAAICSWLVGQDDDAGKAGAVAPH